MNPSNFSRLIIYSYLAYMPFSISGNNETCSNEGSSVKCCSGFRNISGKCTECIGFVGEDCLYPCQQGFFGARCKEVCNCSGNETCNQYVGCRSVCERRNENSSGERILDHPYFWLIMAGFIAIQFFLLVAYIGIYLRKGIRWKQNMKVSKTSECSKRCAKKGTEIRDKEIRKEDQFMDSIEENIEIGKAYDHIHLKKVASIENGSDEYGSVKRHNTDCKKHTMKAREIILNESDAAENVGIENFTPRSETPINGGIYSVAKCI